MRWAAIFSMFLALMLAGCGDISPSDANNLFSASGSVKAASLLKQYQVAQMLYRNQMEGRYGTLQELFAQGMVDDLFAAASAKQKHPAAINGYLFADLEQDSDGKALKRHVKAGLCAYPEDGSEGVILLLLDSNDPEEWSVYWADSKVRGPVTRWPSAADLDKKFTRKGKRSPEQAEKEANEIMDALKP